MKKKFSVVTLGCRTNQYESEAYVRQMESVGYTRAKEGEKADLCIVNTCTVTASADAHSRHQIRGIARAHPGAQLVVTGCMAERVPDEVKAIEGVSAVVSNSRKESLLEDLFPEEEFPEFAIENFSAHTRAFVKVQDGCNSFCTYCILPYIRGRSRSRKVEPILEEVRALIKNGYKEVVITGINVGDFDGNPEKGEKGTSLAELVKQVDAIDGIERVRISSIDPDEVDDALMDAVINGKHTCHSMHIVLQSGSNVILKRMNRKYTKQVFLESIDRLKKASADFTFTTDVIVGFPGESQSDFSDTLDVVREVNFAKVHMFPYSDRPRTRSALYKNKVAPHLIKERKQRLLRLAEEKGFALRERFIGREMDVLLEGKDVNREGYISGHTENFLPVAIDNREKKLSSNQIIRVLLEENSPDALIGKEVALAHSH